MTAIYTAILVLGLGGIVSGGTGERDRDEPIDFDGVVATPSVAYSKQEWIDLNAAKLAGYDLSDTALTEIVDATGKKYELQLGKNFVIRNPLVNGQTAIMNNDFLSLRMLSNCGSGPYTGDCGIPTSGNLFIMYANPVFTGVATATHYWDTDLGSTINATFRENHLGTSYVAYDKLTNSWSIDLSFVESKFDVQFTNPVGMFISGDGERITGSFDCNGANDSCVHSLLNSGGNGWLTDRQGVFYSWSTWRRSK